MTEKTALAPAGPMLQEGRAGWQDAVMVRVQLTGTGHFSERNELDDAYFAEQGLTGPPAARTTVCVGLPPGLPAEFDALAVPD